MPQFVADLLYNVPTPDLGLLQYVQVYNKSTTNRGNGVWTLNNHKYQLSQMDPRDELPLALTVINCVAKLVGRKSTVASIINLVRPTTVEFTCMMFPVLRGILE